MIIHILQTTRVCLVKQSAPQLVWWNLQASASVPRQPEDGFALPLMFALLLLLLRVAQKNTLWFMIPRPSVPVTLNVITGRIIAVVKLFQGQSASVMLMETSSANIMTHAAGLLTATQLSLQAVMHLLILPKYHRMILPLTATSLSILTFGLGLSITDFDS